MVPGTHIRTNCLNAALAMKIMGVESGRIAEILGKWSGIEHRLEFFHETELNGTRVRFYNDSAATVPEAAALASQSFGRPVILISGGTDKGLDLSPLSDALASEKSVKPESIYLLSGTATDKLLELFSANRTETNGVFGSLDELLKRLKEDLEKSTDSEKIVVFSPGATSFGMFRNEFDRGRQFKEKVREIFI